MHMHFKKYRNGGGPKMAEEYDGETTFPTNISKEHLNAEKFHKLLLNASRGHQSPRKASPLSSKGW